VIGDARADDSSADDDDFRRLHVRIDFNQNAFLAYLAKSSAYFAVKSSFTAKDAKEFAKIAMKPSLESSAMPVSLVP